MDVLADKVWPGSALGRGRGTTAARQALEERKGKGRGGGDRAPRIRLAATDPKAALLMGRSRGGWSALTLARHFIRLHRRTSPLSILPTETNADATREPGVWSLGKPQP